MTTGEDLEWLSSYVLGVLKSPTWVSPIAQFIDDRCDIFDDTEENRLEHTQCHDEYKQLINGLLTSHLLEVSVTPEEFECFCERGLTNNSQLHRALVPQLLSVDDFLTFKAMMAKHNADLDREVITFETLDNEEFVSEPQSPTRLVADRVVANSIAEGVKCNEDWQLYEDQLCRALEESEANEEGLDAQQRCEEAELEQAIALSLQLEGERLRQLETSEGSLDSVPVGLAPPVESPRPPVLPATAGFYSAPLCPLPPKLKAKAPEVPRMVQVGPLASAPARGGPWGFTSAPLCAVPPEPPAAAPAPAPEAQVASPPPAEPLVAPRIVGFTSSPLCFRPPGPKLSSQAAAVAGDAAPALAEAVQQPPQTQVEDMRSNLELWRERAERVFAPPEQPSVPGKRQMPRPSVTVPRRVPVQAPGPTSGPSEEERRQRAEHLARQRDLLKQRRQREREQQLAQFQGSRGRGQASVAAAVDASLSNDQRAAASRRLVAESTPGAVVAGPTTVPLPDTAVAADRMRQALTLQLRQTLMRSMVSDAAVLDGQLSQLESLRSGHGR